MSGAPPDRPAHRTHPPRRRTRRPETDEEFLFATRTRGGIGAIGAFAKAYGTVYRQKPGKLPVVELRASDYAHPNNAYGRVDVPVFELVDWVDEADLLSGEVGVQTRTEAAFEPR